MNFYNTTHPYYCGIDLHARSLYVCIIDQAGETCVHKEISADPDKLAKLLEPYLGQVVVGVLRISVRTWALISFWGMHFT